MVLENKRLNVEKQENQRFKKKKKNYTKMFVSSEELEEMCA